MRNWTRTVLSAAAVPLLVCAAAQGVAAQQIEAVRGKQYKLTRQHGPWMIMVASFHEVPGAAQSERKGLTPEQAAHELVYELRKKGIPAYTFSQDDVYDQVQTLNRYGQEQTRRILAQQGSICVLAGNYRDSGDAVAQKTLAWVKKFEPEFLGGVKVSGKIIQLLNNGGLVRKTPGRPQPLSGAFLTINPLLSPAEVAQQKTDLLLLQLNRGSDHSLLDNPGRYTVVVASFYGQSITEAGREKVRELERNFQVSNRLDVAAQNAWELTRALRQGNFVINDGKTSGRQQAFEAWVFHDRDRSVVTIGSFDSPSDPRIQLIQNTFKAKTRTNAQTRTEFLTAEILTIPPFPKNDAPERMWLFDPAPTLMEVPRLR